MSDSVATSQVEEVDHVAEQVQPQGVETSDASKVEADQVPKSEDKEVEQTDEPTESESKLDFEGDKKESSEETTEEKPTEDGEKPTESKIDDEVAATNGAEHSEEINGKEVAEDVVNNNQEAEAEAKPESEPVVEETNGVCKRKVSEPEAESVADEKSPKKAKVVEDGDKAPVEETAA